MTQPREDQSSDGPASEPSQVSDAGETVEYEVPPQRIGWRKGLVLVVAVVVVWTIVESHKRIGWTIEWATDLDKCLELARRENKAVVLLVHKRDCSLTKDIDRDVFSIEPIYLWANKGIPCRLIWEEHPEVVRRYKLRESPTLLCLTPKGKDIFRWEGDAITPEIRKRFFYTYLVDEKDEATDHKPSSTTPAAPGSK